MLINDQFMIFSKIGNGSFGSVFKGIDIENQEYIAAKIEDSSIPKKRLEKESQIYTYISENNKVMITPKLKWYGSNNQYNILVLSRLGHSLEKVAKIANYQLSLKTLLILTVKTLKILEIIHDLNIIHQDIKPDNFAIGYQNLKNNIFIFDFGLSKIFQSKLSNKNNSLIGTLRYASLRAHKGETLSYRDDLESLMYMLVYLYNGKLPWQNINFTDNENKEDKQQAIYELKKNINLAQLCQSLPNEYQKIIIYARNLPYEQKPNYTLLQQMLSDLYKSLGYELDDYNFEWINWSPEKFIIDKSSPKNKNRKMTEKKTLKSPLI